MKRQTKAEIRAEWMRAYEEHLIKLCPSARGKVDWDTATYHFLSGHDAVDSATRSAEVRNSENLS